MQILEYGLGLGVGTVTYLLSDFTIRSLQSGIFCQSHDRRERDSSLVDRLKEVCSNHDDQNTLIDLLSKFGIALRGDVNSDIRSILSQFLIDSL